VARRAPGRRHGVLAGGHFLAIGQEHAAPAGGLGAGPMIEAMIEAGPRRPDQ
jgi:hypothetical protein